MADNLKDMFKKPSKKRVAAGLVVGALVYGLIYLFPDVLNNPVFGSSVIFLLPLLGSSIVCYQIAKKKGLPSPIAYGVGGVIPFIGFPIVLIAKKPDPNQSKTEKDVRRIKFLLLAILLLLFIFISSIMGWF